MKEETIFWIIFFAIVIIVVTQLIYKHIYTNFVEKHSILLKNIRELNDKYKFNQIREYNYDHEYDNENIFDDLTCKDYLIYLMKYISRLLREDINKAKYNKELYEFYYIDFNGIKKMHSNKFDTEITLKNIKYLSYLEKKQAKKNILKPEFNVTISIKLVLTKINGAYVRKKTGRFNTEEIEDLLKEFKKVDGRYSEKIWKSISKIERAKVSNRMRFAVYKRDDYRCQKCGRKNIDLEVDHIIPISKGGKTTMDNLQTLCHKCNMLKSDKIEVGDLDKKCPKCGEDLIVRKGKYGLFYGCTNYPKCKYTENI